MMQWDERVSEPYIPLPRHPDFRLTPWRTADGPAALELFNEETIGKLAFQKPYPYLPQHLQYFTDLTPISEYTITHVVLPFLSPQPTPTPWTAEGIPYFPFVAIRHVPSGKMIGEIQLSELSDEPAYTRAGLRADQWRRCRGLSYNLLPQYRGFGLGGAVLDAVIHVWVKHVGIERLVALIETNNTASTGLVKSRGFTRSEPFMQDWPADKGGGQREVILWVSDMTG